MANLRAVVRRGRITLDEPTELPEGTVLELLSSDTDGQMSREELADLDGTVAESVARAQRGELHPARDLIARLRASR